MALIKHHFYVKMLIAISISIAVFCITSNLVIATLFGEQLVKKTRTINREYASVVYSYLSEMDENLELLGLLAENNSNIRWAMSQKSLSMTSAKKYALAAQESLDAYLNASPLFEEEIQRNRSVIQITPSASDSEQMVLAYLYPLNAALDSFIYIELDPEIIQGYLDVYQDSADLMVRSMGRYEATWFSSEGFKQRYENGEINEKGYLMDTMDFAPDCEDDHPAYCGECNSSWNRTHRHVRGDPHRCPAGSIGSGRSAGAGQEGAESEGQAYCGRFGRIFSEKKQEEAANRALQEMILLKQREDDAAAAVLSDCGMLENYGYFYIPFDYSGMPDAGQMTKESRTELMRWIRELLQKTAENIYRSRYVLVDTVPAWHKNLPE